MAQPPANSRGWPPGKSSHHRTSTQRLNNAAHQTDRQRPDGRRYADAYRDEHVHAVFDIIERIPKAQNGNDPGQG